MRAHSVVGLLLLAFTVLATSPVAAAGSKVVVCHKPATRAERTINVGAAAVAAHLRHGDILGACGAASTLVTPRLNEVFYDQVGGTAGEFVEIVGPAGFSLQGWELRLIDGATGNTYMSIDFLASTVISASGFYVIGVALQNGPDAVQLRNGAGALIDAVQYGNAGANNAGEGSPAPDVPAGKSLSRDSFHTDTNNNAADFSAATPSPGS